MGACEEITMGKKLTVEEQTNQINTYTLDAKDFIRSKTLIDEMILPEPYLIIMDDKPLDNLAKAINILRIKRGYTIVSFSITPFFGFSIMEKK